MEDSSEKFKLPRSEKINMIELDKCELIQRKTDLPESVKGKYKKGYLQGIKCNAKLGKNISIQKEINGIVDEARIFCDVMQNPDEKIPLSKKNKAEFIKIFGEEKGKFFWENESYSFEGREDPASETSNTCTVAMKVSDKSGHEHVIAYESPKIYIRKKRNI